MHFVKYNNIGWTDNPSCLCPAKRKRNFANSYRKSHPSKDKIEHKSDFHFQFQFFLLSVLFAINRGYFWEKKEEQGIFLTLFTTFSRSKTLKATEFTDAKKNKWIYGLKVSNIWEQTKDLGSLLSNVKLSWNDDYFFKGFILISLG